MENKSTFYVRYGTPAVLVIVGALSLLVYSNAFFSPFQFDDFFYIADNQRLKDLSNFWPPFGARYVVYLSFALNYLTGGTDVFGYHLVNVLIHAANGALVYLLALSLFRTPRMKAGLTPGDGAPAFAVALTAAVLFIVHPIQTEAVTYITQRFASLATLFYLLSVVLYLKWRTPEAGGKPGYILYVLTLVFAVASQKSKEISFTLPFVISLMEFMFFGGDKDEATAKRRLIYLVPFLVSSVIIPLDVFGPDIGIGRMDSLNEMMRKYQMKDLTAISRHDYLITQFSVIASYLRLLVLPIGQNADHAHPLFTSILVPKVFLSFLLLIAVGALAVHLFIRSRRGGGALCLLAAFGIFWFFMTVSVESSIIPIKDIMVEHRLYLPSAGLFITFSAASFWCAGRARARFGFELSEAAFAMALLIIIALPLGVSAYARNLLWNDPVLMCEDMVGKSPDKAGAHYALANAYYERGRVDDAIREWREAARLDPSDAFIHYKLSEAYYRQGRTAEAVEHYRDFKRAMSGRRR